MKIPVFTITFDISTFYKHIHVHCQSKLLQHHPIPKIAYIGSMEDECKISDIISH